MKPPAETNLKAGGDWIVPWPGDPVLVTSDLYRKPPPLTTPAKASDASRSRGSSVRGSGRREWIAILGALTEQQDAHGESVAAKCPIRGSVRQIGMASFPWPSLPPVRGSGECGPTNPPLTI